MKILNTILESEEVLANMRFKVPAFFSAFGLQNRWNILKYFLIRYSQKIRLSLFNISNHPPSG